MKRRLLSLADKRGCHLHHGGEEIKELCQSHNIPVELIQCRVNEIETYMRAFDMHHCQGGS